MGTFKEPFSGTLVNIYNSWVSSLFETVPGSLIRSVQKRRQRYYTSSQNYYNCVGVYQVIVYSVNKWHGKTTDQCQNVESTNYNFLVTFIKSLNQSNIKPCLIVHLVAMWTLIRLRNTSRPKFFSKNYKFFSQKRKTNAFVARTIQHSCLLEFTAKKLRRLLTRATSNHVWLSTWLPCEL